MTKTLNGKELAGFVKERQAHVASTLLAQGIQPKLVIIRDSNNPVITKYVNLKCNYGEDIGIEVEDVFVQPSTKSALISAVESASQDPSVHGIIVQLPLTDTTWTDEIVEKIAPAKDVDGLSDKGEFDSATATAINWLLSGYGIDLANRKIAIVGNGRLVGHPLSNILKSSGYDITVFNRTSDLSDLINYDVIITATGQPHLIKSEYIQPGAVVVDAGTASENGVLVGDLDESVRERTDLSALTPKVGGVGPLTVGVLFENVLAAASKSATK